MERLVETLNEFQLNRNALITIRLKSNAKEITCSLKYVFINSNFVLLPEYNQYKMIPLVNIEQMSFPTEMVDTINKEIA